jgi:sugar/nucleoside kinase (ribokinase family)
MSRVLVVGDLVTDVLVIPAGPIAEGTDTAAAISITGGGSAANTAAWLRRTGRPVTLVAAVGEDPAGRQRVAELEALGVDCAVVRRGVTGTVVVIATGDERSMLCDRGANAALAPDVVDRALAEHSDGVHVHVSGYPLLDPRSLAVGRHTLAAAREAGLSVSVDAASAGPLRSAPDFLSWVRDADLLFANHDEARVLAGDGPPEQLARRLADAVGTAIVKLGADGAIWASATDLVRVPAAPATVVDVTGAGDAFAAGALAAWLSGAQPSEVLKAGAVLAAEAVSRPGARPTG